MKDWQKIILEEIKSLQEAVKVNFQDHTFALKVDVNEDPNKKGIKIQFLPTTFTAMSKTQQDEIAMELEEIEQKVNSDGDFDDRRAFHFFHEYGKRESIQRRKRLRQIRDKKDGLGQ